MTFVINSLFVCNFYIQGLSENHHVVGEHSVQALNKYTNIFYFDSVQQGLLRCRILTHKLVKNARDEVASSRTFLDPNQPQL